jgi:hypothetical protein
MPFSLADCILKYHDPAARECLRPAGSGRATEFPAAGWPPRAPAARPRDEVAAVRGLVHEMAREWSELLASVASLKRAMKAEDLEAAFRAEGLAALFPGAREQPPVPPRSGAASPPPPPAAPAPARSRPPETPEPAVAENPEVHSRIVELLQLLRENIRENAAGKEETRKPATVEIPRAVTMEIAREVAGRVRESLTTLPPPAGEPAPGARVPAEAPRKIPLDDVSAIIDQITGVGGDRT